uniref:Nucleolar 27S pre-rRNA processing Urb2/Npa2 C-terminal domain-containing protein n=1 Tax=Cajanus cajan TaxID=3821 RepID=A0A151RAU1_CAJCA|nr:hypothetical protein KK1_039030 [Cajanus cajan]
MDDGVGSDQDREAVKLARLLCYLNDWILTLLFPPNGKENWGNAKTPQLEGVEAYMDVRCWEIFKFCLEKSLKFRVSMNMSRNLLQTIQFIARDALSLLEESSVSSGELYISDERYKLYDTALDCVSLVFSSHGGDLDGSKVGAFALRFLCLVLQPFSKFLMVHSARKGFQNFVDKLLEPLLQLSGELHLRVSGSNPIWTQRLIKEVEAVLSHGLFQLGHIDVFLSLHGSETIKSYPRHLFDALNKIIVRKNAMAMGSLGLLFHLYVNSARKFKEAPVLEGSKTMEKMVVSRQPAPEEQRSSNNTSADIQNSLFNFFVLIMEPLLLKINAYIQVEVDAKSLLLDLRGLLKSIGNLLASFMQDKVYVRTEDTSGGACLNFLKKIFNTLITGSTSVFYLSNYDTTNKMEILSLSANEILVAMGYLLEIEYEVIGEDLVNLWLLILACSTINCNFDRCSLSSTIHALGCQIINLYCQLRQVEIAILALCKAIRLTISHERDTEDSSSRFLTFLSNELYTEAVERLLSSKKFIHAIYKGVGSIPEGQVRGCVRQITDDISESLRWMKDFCLLVDGNKLQIFNLQVELLGRGLSRLYCLVLDSVTITGGNSSLLGIAVKELMALMRPYLSILVGQQSDTICKFFSSVIGESVDQVVRKRKVLKKFGRSSQWVLVFFFQLFVSCRSFYRKAISLMPPGLSKKMSVEVEDYTTYSAFKLMERIDEMDIGYFSWIVQPSASLLVVMQLISDIYLKHGSDDSSPLIYIFQSMAIQRLIDLNKQVILFKYLQKKRYRSKIDALEEEAAGLTNFMMENLSCVLEIDDCKLLKRVTLSQISSELLHDSLLYEQEFARRNLASMFCHALEKSVLPLFSNIPCTDVNLKSSPNWLEFLSVLDNSTTHSCDKLPVDIDRKEKTFPLTNQSFRDCHHLLDHLCWMPDINARSFSHLVTCIFNLERLLVSALLYFQSSVYQDYYCEYLRLFVSCRKALRFIVKGFCEKADTTQSSPNSIISGNSFPVLWISKSLSVVVGIKEAFSAKSIILCKSLIHKENHLLPSSEDSPKLEALKCLTFISENLKEQVQSLLVSVHNTPRDVSVGFGLSYENIDRLSSSVSCFGGVLWGLTSYMGQIDSKECDKKEKVLMWKSEHAFELDSCISSLVELTDLLVNKLLFETVTQQESKAAATCFTSSAIDNVSKSASDLERMLNPESETSVARVLASLDSTEPQGLNKPLLQSLVKGDHPEIAFSLRQLLIASSSLLRLNLKKGDCFYPSSSVPTLIEVSQVLLLEYIEMVVVPQQSAFLLLNGALSYLRELAGYFPFTDPSSSIKIYTKLIQIQMRAIGKTILLQGKRATLTYHERQSLVGVQEGCTMIYNVKTSKDGGDISSLVAAGIDCFDMILDFVSGRKGLKMIKRHCQSLVAAVFNIILHLQSPLIFYDNLASGTVASTPDPGAAILMCVKVLVTVSRKQAIFQTDVWHVGHLLHIPASLFQNFHQLRVTKASGPSEALEISKECICDPVERVNFCHLDHHYSVNLFVVCCQLLCTIIRNRPSECKQCVAHLGASVAVLLNCLETVLDNESLMNKGCFSSEEGVKCACFLRRIYEEIKEKKDIFGRQCSLFLSDYIWVYSGYGPKKSGIRREVDEALRPGVYALIDACTVDDLQYLHTVFGEGPCRSTLASLQHDYKLNFKYEGKV